MNRSFLTCLALIGAFCASTHSVHALPSSTNIQLWFRADAGVTTNGSGNVSTWADQSGNGNDATNLTLANQPLWIDNTLNGMPVVRFDGANDVLSTLSSVNLTNGLSIFIIAKNATRKNYQGIFRLGAVPYSDPSNLEVYWQQGDTDAGSGHLVYTVNRSPGTFGGLLAGNAPPPVGNYYLYDVLASSTAETQRINGVSLVSTPLGAANLPGVVNPAHLGIGYGGQSGPGGPGTGGLLSGDIAEVIVYNITLSTSDRRFVEEFLADKYGLSIPEPGSFAFAVGGLVFVIRNLRHHRGKA